MRLRSSSDAIAKVWRCCARSFAVCLASAPVLGDTQTAPIGCPQTAVRVYVDAVGIITVNDTVVRTADLRRTLASLKPPPAEACYAYADTQNKVPPEAGIALRALAAQRLPITLYTDNTFKTQRSARIRVLIK